MIIEKLLRNTEFKDDAADIARQFKKVGIETLDRLGDAPGLLQSARVWGYPLSEVIKAIREAAEKIEASKEKEVAKPKTEMPASEPAKPALRPAQDATGGTK